MAALVVGCDGQDGKIMCSYLNSIKMEYLKINRQGLFSVNDLLLASSDFSPLLMRDIFLSHKVTQIYFFAANSDPDGFREIINKSTEGKNSQKEVFELLKNILETISSMKSEVRIFFTSTSLIYLGSKETPQNESTPESPQEDYSIQKIEMTNYILDTAKANLNISAQIGIMYNHESVFRKKGFFSRKVIETALQLSNHKNNNRFIEIRKPDAIIDMSYAEDFIINAYNLVQHGESGKFIFSSGTGIKAKDFAHEVMDSLNLDSKKYLLLRNDDQILSNIPLIGDNSKIKKILGSKYRYTDNLSQKLIQDWKKVIGS
jgi:GDP-D-mannose dehydratase